MTYPKAEAGRPLSVLGTLRDSSVLLVDGEPPTPALLSFFASRWVVARFDGESSTVNVVVVAVVADVIAAAAAAAAGPDPGADVDGPILNESRPSVFHASV